MAVSRWKLFADAAAEGGDGCFQFGDLVACGAGRWGGWLGRFEHTSADEHMKRRMIVPVGKKIMDFPKREPRDLIEGPAGSGCDVAEEERPIG